MVGLSFVQCRKVGSCCEKGVADAVCCCVLISRVTNAVVIAGDESLDEQQNTSSVNLLCVDDVLSGCVLEPSLLLCPRLLPCLKRLPISPIGCGNGKSVGSEL